MINENQSASALLGVVLDGSYRIESLLGEGGMGAVYRATQLRLDKPVAVKVMARELAANQEALERFRREARVTSGLGHPNIVQVFDFSATPTGEPFFVLEFLEGEDLDHRLRRVGRLPISDVVHVVKQVASALAATHAKGIVHRDLKPGNIYLLDIAGTKDFVKVLDFGISKVRSASTKLTRTSSIMGTPNYMSPEQARGQIDDIDERTDQWALGCIAWECLAGRGPFVGENVPPFCSRSSMSCRHPCCRVWLDCIHRWKKFCCGLWQRTRRNDSPPWVILRRPSKPHQPAQRQSCSRPFRSLRPHLRRTLARKIGPTRQPPSPRPQVKWMMPSITFPRRRKDGLGSWPSLPLRGCLRFCFFDPAPLPSQ